MKQIKWNPEEGSDVVLKTVYADTADKNGSYYNSIGIEFSLDEPSQINVIYHPKHNEFFTASLEKIMGPEKPKELYNRFDVDETYGLDDNEMKWIRDYVSDRTMMIGHLEHDLELLNVYGKVIMSGAGYDNLEGVLAAIDHIAEHLEVQLTIEGLNDE